MALTLLERIIEKVKVEISTKKDLKLKKFFIFTYTPKNLSVLSANKSNKAKIIKTGKDKLKEKRPVIVINKIEPINIIKV
jgi:hypothetical protein